MLNETTQYQLSLYLSQKIYKATSNCRIETVLCTLDEKIYIKRSYADDKRELFHILKKDVASEHIPQIYCVIFDEDTIVIEQYIEGESLEKLIENRHITKKQAHKIIRQLFEALKDLHRHSIIHRDVKPDNILLDKEGNAWLIDFGISRFHTTSAQKDTEQFGTIGYAPPEQFGFSQTDYRSDLFAAGITALEVGKAAGLGKNSAIMKIARRCTEFDPSRRYASADSVLRAIQQKAYRTKWIALSAALFLVVSTAIFQSAISFINKSALIKPQIPVDAHSFVADDDSNANNLDMRWTNIIINNTEQTLLMLPVPNGSIGTKDILLTQKQPQMSLQYELSNSTLILTLTDQQRSAQTFQFSYEPAMEAAYTPDYTDTKIDAEIILYDMDNDGQDELLVALSDRACLDGVKNTMICNTNWRAIWCIGYTKGTGFWQADGRLSSFGNDGMIYINYLGERELYCNNTHTWVCLVGQSLKENM